MIMFVNHDTNCVVQDVLINIYFSHENISKLQHISSSRTDNINNSTVYRVNQKRNKTQTMINSCNGLSEVHFPLKNAAHAFVISCKDTYQLLTGLNQSSPWFALCLVKY